MGVPYEIRRSTEALDDSFMEFGTCQTEGHRREIFFAEFGRSAADRMMTKEAQELCSRCPVQGDCFQYALDADEHGVWGGTTREQRLYYRRHGHLPPPAPLRKERRRG